MAEVPTQNEVVLGFHSPTEWVFFPEVVALYDRIVINHSVFEKAVSEGERSASLYQATKAELLKQLVQKGIPGGGPQCLDSKWG